VKQTSPPNAMLNEIVEALYNASGHELTRDRLIMRFYGRYDVSTATLDRAINLLSYHNRVIQWTGQGYRLSDKYMSSDDYKVRSNEQDYTG
jgi:DNA-binding winged helix-turn-helix (wHTH) protein